MKISVILLPSTAAGNAFCKAARLHMQLQNKHDCATSFIDAGNAYKKSDPNGKIAWLLSLNLNSIHLLCFLTHNNSNLTLTFILVS